MNKLLRNKYLLLALTLSVILIGTGVLAFGIACFFDPIGLVTGGVTGLAIVIKSVTGGLIEGGIPLWFTNAAFNIPMFILAYFLKGKKFESIRSVGRCAECVRRRHKKSIQTAR